jgi:hypothetical protein
MEGVLIYSFEYLLWALDEGKWAASSPSRFISAEKPLLPLTIELETE